MADLFDSAPSADTKAAGPRPLADRLRPQNLSEVIGQRHILGPDGSLRVMLDAGSLGSLIFWGPPGVGKTTIARLIPSLIRVGAGQVLIDGVPIEEIPLGTLRAAIGYVPQDTFLFSDTIRENVALGQGPTGTTVLDGPVRYKPTLFVQYLLPGICRNRFLPDTGLFSTRLPDFVGQYGLKKNPDLGTESFIGRRKGIVHNVSLLL